MEAKIRDRIREQRRKGIMKKLIIGGGGIWWALNLMVASTQAQSTYLVDNLAHHTNAIQNTTNLVTYSGVTFTCYIDDELQAIVAGSSNMITWIRQSIGPVLDDAHNGCSIGIDHMGYIWVAYNMHDTPSFTGYLKRSAYPFDVSSTFIDKSISLSTLPFSISYPTFHRAGGELYLLFRNGTSGYGDTWMLRLSAPDTWTVVGSPIISGKLTNPADSQYLGNSWPESNGNLHLIWVNRVGWDNVSLGYAMYDRASNVFRKSNGAVYSLPITRSTMESIDISTAGLEKPVITNTGLSVAKTPDGALHVGFNKLAVDGYREVFYATKPANSSYPWLLDQVSNANEPRLRITPCNPPSSGPSVCDLEVQGPQIVTKDGQLILLWSVASDREYSGVWGRPPSKLYIARGLSGGGVSLPVWTYDRIPVPVDRLGGEMSRDGSGLPKLMYQELDSHDSDSPLSIMDVSSLFNPSKYDGSDRTCQGNQLGL